MIGRLTGTSVTRVEDGRILSGHGLYVDDVSVPGLLHAAFVRSPHAHARVVGVRVEEARLMPGVVAVWSDEEMRGWASDIQPTQIPGLTAVPFSVLARGKVRAVGDPVAVIVAESRAQAEDAGEVVEVDYQLLDPVVDPVCANPLVWEEAGTNVMFRSRHEVGDVEGVFASAARTFSYTLRQHRHANVPMEGHGAVAIFDPRTGNLEYWVTHQNPHALRVGLARVLDFPANRIRVRCGDIGGAFGQKGYLLREHVAVAAAARELGRPVKWIEDRYENLVFGGQARDETVEVEAAVDDAGVISGLRVRMTLDQGAYPMSGFAAAAITNLVRVLLPAAYRVTALAFEAVVAATNKATYVAYRGPWEMETWVRERLIDLIARDLSIDPVEMRRRNLWSDQDIPARMCTGPELIGITQRETLERVVAAAGYDDFRRRQADLAREGRYLGIGVANVVEPAPLPPSVIAAMGGTAAPRTVQQARIRVEPDGSVTVYTSQQPHGQGHETTLAQLVADELGVDIASIRVVHGDTAETPFNMVGTGGSRSATLASGAVLAAGRAMRERILEVASRLLEIDPADLELTDGRVRPAGAPAYGVSLAEIARSAYLTPGRVTPDGLPGLEVLESFSSGEGTWSQATHCATVAVDIETGAVEVLRYVVVEDCGSIINPAIVEGQIRGGVAQGIGSVLLERSAYGADGQFLSGTLMDYLLPTSLDIPSIEIHHLESDPVSEVNYRGVGEGGAIGAPAAISNAIEDALSPFGVRITEQHLPPARIAELLGLC